jgi:TatD DNase family protein
VPHRNSARNASGEAPPLLTDTHVHLNLDSYDQDREDVVRRARSVGVSLMVNVGFDLTTSRESIELAERYDFVYASVGLHPHEAASFDEAARRELERLAEHPKVVAIGETGLDYYRDLSPRDDQRRAFRAQIELARKLDLPLIVHNRDALDDVLAVVDDEALGGAGGVMHCFPGDGAYAEAVVARGFHVGIAGPVTYSKSGRLVGVAESVPIGRLLLETDAPWLPPVPYRGKRNEPSYVLHVAETVARIRGLSVPDLARATAGNAGRLFRIPGEAAPSIAYEMWGNLYLNITNRCTNECSFCLRYQTDSLWGYNLRLDSEPTVLEIVEAIGDPTVYREVVFCGYGEPTLRLDALVEVARWIGERGGRVRVDTNGLGSAVWKRNIVPELAEIVDAVSVSLNAADAATYESICRPQYGVKSFDHVVAFVRECRKARLDVTVSVVDVPEIDLAEVAALADELGVPLKVRGSANPRRAARRG